LSHVQLGAAARVLDRLNTAATLRFTAIHPVRADAVYGFWPDGQRTIEDLEIPWHTISIPLADIPRVTAARPISCSPCAPSVAAEA
jgi:hypothetical protein